MAYEKMTAERWFNNLQTGKFLTAGSAKKSIAKTGWSERMKTKAREMADRYFEDPNSVKLTDLSLKALPVGKPPAPIKSDLLAEMPAAVAVKVANTDLSMVLGIQHTIRSCKDAFDALHAAKQLYPEIDVSNGMVLVEEVLNPALFELSKQYKQMFNKPVAVEKGNGQSTKNVPSITPCYTVEQRELFDKTQPKIPFTPTPSS